MVATTLGLVLAGCAPAPDAPPRAIAYREVGRFPVGEHPVALAVLGNDVYVPGLVAPTLTVVEGGLVARPPVELPGGVLSVAVGDFDEDGADELALSMPPARRIAILGGGAWESDDPGFIAAGDVDGDGHVDLVSASATATLLRGDGAGGLETAGTIAAPDGVSSVTIADVDGDGANDVLMTGWRDATLWLDAGTSVMTAATAAWPLHVVGVQLDSDAPLELVGAANQGDALFVANLRGADLDLEELAFIGQPAMIACGDLDGDGDEDLAVTAKGGDRVDLLAGDGRGGLAPAVTLPTGWGPTPVALSDLDDDGCLDIAVANSFSNDVVIFFCKEEPHD